MDTTTTAVCETRYFGPVDYDEESVLEFPEGIPSFETERRFLVVRQPANYPMVFLQSLSDQDLCFVALPVSAASPRYRLRIPPEDLAALGLPAHRP